MYTPHFFKHEDLNDVRAFIARHSFGILVSQQNGSILATHIPMEFSTDANGNHLLTGHISKGNPQRNHFTAGARVVAIFTGPHAYVSSSWYDHENVPTWNYIAVHVEGVIRVTGDDETLPHLRQLVNKYEAASKCPVSVETMTSSFLIKEMKGIVGFEIRVEKVEAAYKLSQNRDETNYLNIISELEKRADPDSLAVAEAMKKERGL